MPMISWKNLRSPVALAAFLIPAIGGVVADLWTKAYAFGVLLIRWVPTPVGMATESRTYRFIPGWLHFEVTVNQGAVFGMGQGQRILFLIVSIAAIFFLVYLFANSGRQRFYQIVLGMLLAGVLGNMHDRVVFGYVRDMIHGVPGWHWPGSQREVFPWIFNVADCLLCVGVFLLVIHSFFQKPLKNTADRPADGAAAPGSDQRQTHA